ncbi:esterase-like activity of phytase family protein [Rhizobium sp. CFBP 8762]|uniref:esterase-like activity of phytase family protein n=1 Tax=Rhizobium sp. CFBP 8762 TaxID=2775279 RepID=UPI001FD086F3|nr:esterase-like activity of phytase family protein [Rhizobium sp. CFBP 8762]
MRRFLSVTLCCSGLLSGTALADESKSIDVRSRQIADFKIGSQEKRFGSLEFVGGLELTSSSWSFGAISSIRFRADRSHFIAVMDDGHWLKGRTLRDATGALSGLADVTISSILLQDKTQSRRKQAVDAEGLTLHSGEAWVSFEREARIDAYPDPGMVQSGPIRSIPILIPETELRANQGLETIATSPAGFTVTIAEDSVDPNDNLFAAILDGADTGLFRVTRKPPFAVTDGAFLPNGDLLLLERSYSYAQGVGMQIRRIPGDSIKPGAVVDGAVLITADFGYEIDNMEGMDVLTMPDGELRIILVSDDNKSILQRNIVLEFRLKKPVSVN